MGWVWGNRLSAECSWGVPVAVKGAEEAGVGRGKGGQAVMKPGTASPAPQGTQELEGPAEWTRLGQKWTRPLSATITQFLPVAVPRKGVTLGGGGRQVTSPAAGQLGLPHWRLWAVPTGLPPPSTAQRGSLKSQVLRGLSCFLGAGAGLMGFPSVGRPVSLLFSCAPRGWLGEQNETIRQERSRIVSLLLSMDSRRTGLENGALALGVLPHPSHPPPWHPVSVHATVAPESKTQPLEGPWGRSQESLRPETPGRASDPPKTIQRAGANWLPFLGAGGSCSLMQQNLTEPFAQSC